MQKLDHLSRIWSVFSEKQNAPDIAGAGFIETEKLPGS